MAKPNYFAKAKDVCKKGALYLGAALSYATPLVPGDVQKKIARELYGAESKAIDMTEKSSIVEIGAGAGINALTIFVTEAAFPPAAVVFGTAMLADSVYRLLENPKEPKGSLVVESLERVGKSIASYAGLNERYAAGSVVDIEL